MSSCNDEQKIADIQIRNLKQRLEFTKRALLEREEQLEHYKQLVCTLQGLVSSSSVIPFCIQKGPKEEPKKNRISKAKNVSFHNDVQVRYIPEKVWKIIEWLTHSRIG